MSRVSFPICVSTVLVVLLGLSMVTTPASAQQKPNIVIIWGDDIGQSNLSVYTKGMMGYRTPNIDRIAERRASLHRLLRRAELHRRSCGLHHGPESRLCAPA